VFTDLHEAMRSAGLTTEAAAHGQDGTPLGTSTVTQLFLASMQRHYRKLKRQYMQQR